MKKNVIYFGIGVLIVVSLGTWGWTRLFSSRSQQPSAVDGQVTAQEYYTCPMHPSVRSDRPGACPVCQMTLVKKSVPAQVSNRPAGEAGEEYTCPMDASVHSNHPGACPICGMTLVKKSVAVEMERSDLSGLRAVSLSPTQRVMANITTARVQRRTVSNDIQAVGVVSYAEPNYRVISLRFPGRVERLYLSFTGQTVHKGDPVAEVYSSAVIVEEQAYLRALDAYQQTTRTGDESSDPVGAALRRSRERLLQLGFTDKQITGLAESDTLSSFVTVCSPVSGTVVKKSVDPGRYYDQAGAPLFDVADLSTVWILLDVYEKDIRVVRRGLSVQIATEAYPLDKFKGRVVFVDPVLIPETRTVRVRTEFPNPEGKLKPNMYVNATISVPQSNALVVPSTAILPAGKRSIVWVEVDENLFEPREVLVGAVSEGFTVVLEGLKEGESVASTGGFLIDSESALNWTDSDGEKGQ